MKKLTAMALVLILALSATLCAGAASMLQIGDRGDAVRRLQQALVNQGWSDIKVDGIYGPATAEAVKYYQRQNGLTATGRAGSTTLTNLLGAGEVDVNPDGSATVAQGSSGVTVRKIQERLNALGYSVGTVDGKFGKRTLAAVKNFQALNGLAADGKVGAKTTAKLFAADAVAYYKPTVYTKLRRGDTGDLVKKLQTALQAKGYYKGAITGFYSYATVAAVQDFQVANGLRVDGIAGQETLSLLYK